MQKWKKKEESNRSCKYRLQSDVYFGVPQFAGRSFLTLFSFSFSLVFVSCFKPHYTFHRSKAIYKSQSNLYSWMNFQNRKQFKTRTWNRWIRTHMLKNIFQGKFSHWSWVMCYQKYWYQKETRGKKRSHDQFNRRFISYCQSNSIKILT